MVLLNRLDVHHAALRANRWARYFTTFIRLALAVGFFGAGVVKIMGERFTSLSVNHPMGHYLEALHLTGYYYTFIGVAQVLAALLLLFPRTALLGALLYFPIILNICILSLAVRFEGSQITSPLMVLADLYLLCWHYDRLKYIFPFCSPPGEPPLPANGRFPVKFFGGILVTMILVIAIILNMHDIMPRNTLRDCEQQCTGKNPRACKVFCECIHQKGMPLDSALSIYEKANARK